MTRRFIYELLERGGERGDDDTRRSGSPHEAREQRASTRTHGAQRPMSVTQATRAIRRHLEAGFSELLVEGEVSNLSRPASGHWYFTLKDERCQLRAVMFAGDNRRVRFEVSEGLTVLARGRVTYYEGGGRTQLVVRELDPSGVGARALALRQLAERLAKEGLFDDAKKRPLPALPRRVGVVTSATGAALRDILKAARRRFPSMPLLLSPTRVQGDGAEAEIARALRRLDECGLVDVIILGRGGGSFEDLEVFSREVVVRAVAACQTPVVSAVGHEVDHALCDLAADARAATPSAAAALAVPERHELEEALRAPLRRAANALDRRLTAARLRVADARGALSDPRVLVLSRRQDLDRLLRASRRALDRRIGDARARVRRAQDALTRQAPERRAGRARAALQLLTLRQASALRRRVAEARARLESAAATLDALSPLAVLGRGYAICFHQGRALHSAEDVSPGDRVEVRLDRGALRAEVVERGAAPSPRLTPRRPAD